MCDFEEFNQQLAKEKLLPLYTVTDMQKLPDLEKLLVDNAIHFIEITFRSEWALPAISQLAKSGKLIVGAGTVRNVEEAKKAIECGAQFIVSPAVIPSVIEYCLEKSIPVFPGTATPTDIQRVLEYGLKVAKFFPANIYGGSAAIKALSGPFYDMQFLPTGGIDETNVQSYLQLSNVLAVGGSFIISEKMLENLKQTDQHLKALQEKLSV